MVYDKIKKHQNIWFELYRQIVTLNGNHRNGNIYDHFCCLYVVGLLFRFHDEHRSDYWQRRLFYIIYR